MEVEEIPGLESKSISGLESKSISHFPFIISHFPFSFILCFILLAQFDFS